VLALRLDGQPRLAELDPPLAQPGEARLRVRLAGICSTDLHLVRGYMSFAGTLGHEFVGEVIGCDDVEWLGRRVTGEINLACRRCDRCRSGLERHCAARSVLGILGKDGCFAEELTLPVANLHVVPDTLPDELALFTEPLAAAFEVLEQLHVRPTWRVAVLGDGKLGTLVALVVAQSGAEVTLVGRHPHKLARVESAGIRVARVEDALGGDFDAVVEATGSPAGFERARSLLRPRGALVLKSTFHGALQLATAPLVIDELTLVGSRCGPFAPALRALAAGRIDPRPLLEAIYPLRQGLDALAHAALPGASKIVLDPRL
jgi:alcohol dehydrogenase